MTSSPEKTAHVMTLWLDMQDSTPGQNVTRLDAVARCDCVGMRQLRWRKLPIPTSRDDYLQRKIVTLRSANCRRTLFEVVMRQI